MLEGNSSRIMLSDDDDEDEVFRKDDYGHGAESNRRDRSAQNQPIAFSFTGIPMSRQRSNSVTRAPAAKPVEGSGDRPPSGSGKTPRSRRSSVAAPGRSYPDASPAGDAPPNSEGKSSHAARPPTRTESRGRPQSRNQQAESRGRSATRSLPKTPDRSSQGPVRSASCARIIDRRHSSSSNGHADPGAQCGARLDDVKLRQSVHDLRRSLHDLSSSLGFDGPSTATMDDLHRRMEADFEVMRRQSLTNGEVDALDVRFGLPDEEEDEDDELLQLGPKTAVVPPFSVSQSPAPPPEALPPRPGTPSRIPVPRAASPSRPVSVFTPKYKRSQSVCHDDHLLGITHVPPGTYPSAKHASLTRRNSYDVKISTPLVTGRSSIIASGRPPSASTNRCFRPSRKQKQSS